MLDNIPKNPYSRKEIEVLLLITINIISPEKTPIKADLWSTFGKNIPSMNSAPNPLVSSPRNVLN
jgi:hypothetical protein